MSGQLLIPITFGLTELEHQNSLFTIGQFLGPVKKALQTCLAPMLFTDIILH
jgi:hypothetical protein